MRRNRVIVLLAALIIMASSNFTSVLATTGSVYSNVISSVSRLDISNGIIAGEKTEYFIMIPKEIRELLIVDRLVLEENSTAIEQLDFYCISYTHRYKPSILASLYVFEKSEWSDLFNLQVVLKSKDYVFATEIAEKSSFIHAQDNAFYSYCKTYLGGIDSINNLISLPKSQTNMFSNTVFINGTPLKEKLKIVDNVYYLPLRAVFEQMDYDVAWNAKKATVEISKNTFKDYFVMTSGKFIGKGFKILNIDNRTYISTSYLLKILSRSMEIDASNNIYMLT